jgi:hypothetical protein
MAFVFFKNIFGERENCFKRHVDHGGRNANDIGLHLEEHKREKNRCFGDDSVMMIWKLR